MRHTFNTLIRRLSKAGFNREFVRQYLLPDWWDDTSEQDQRLLQDIDIRVARFLGLPLTAISNAAIALQTPVYPNARLRRVRNIERDRLMPAIHSALRIAGAAVRSLHDFVPPYSPLPIKGIEWRKEIKPDGTVITLDDILVDLWGRGVPVLPLELLPSPSFQGLSCIVEGRPVIVLGYHHDEPGRVAHVVAHEAGHIATEDCLPNQPVVDEQEGIPDTSDIEVRAEEFATQALVGENTPPQIEGRDYKELAENAFRIEEETGADAGAIIFDWASRSGDYAMATMAVKALYRGSGGRKQLSMHFKHNFDLDLASESDRTLLRSVYGD